jgi:hypothetical protein
MKWREHRIVGWTSGVVLFLAVGAAAFFLLGAAGTGDEVLSVEVAAYISQNTQFDDRGDPIPARICIAVTSPSRGAVDQLREGNIQVHDPIHGPEGIYPSDSGAVTVQEFTNLGGGFYRIDLLTGYMWEPDQYVLQLEVVCPWGRGITVFDLPIMQAFFKYYKPPVPDN